MKTISRRVASGFVKYPKDFNKRIIDGTARFRTKCDMLVGPCACGGVHQEQDDWVRRLLSEHDANIEQLTLAPEEDGTIPIPRYWSLPRQHLNCTVLSGLCGCGQTHTANERWVVTLLEQHGTKIIGCPETDLPVIEDPYNMQVTFDLEPDCNPSFIDDADPLPGCPCPDCVARRQREHRFLRPGRTDI